MRNYSDYLYYSDYTYNTYGYSRIILTVQHNILARMRNPPKWAPSSLIVFCSRIVSNSANCFLMYSNFFTILGLQGLCKISLFRIEISIRNWLQMPFGKVNYNTFLETIIKANIKIFCRYKEKLKLKDVIS